MTDIAGASVPRRRPGLRIDHDGARTVILDGEGAEVAALDDTAAALWELCDGSTDVEEITDAVCTVWDVAPEVARRDVRATLGTLRDAGLLDWDEEP
jgi:hypothetical protein